MAQGIEKFAILTVDSMIGVLLCFVAFPCFYACAEGSNGFLKKANQN